MSSINFEIIAWYAELITSRNSLQRQRNSVRGKEMYYTNLYQRVRNKKYEYERNRRIPLKWLKPNSLKILLMKKKKYKILKLSLEMQLHNCQVKNHPLMIKRSRNHIDDGAIVRYRLNYNSASGIYCGLTRIENHLTTKYFPIKELNDILINQKLEDILLKDKV